MKKILGSLSILSLAAAASAQIPDSAWATLEEKVAILERKLELKDEDAAKKKDETPVVSAGRDGFSISSPDKDFLLRFRGTVQADGRWFLSDTAARIGNTWLLRRVDPVWEATAWKHYSFRVMVEFANSQFSLQDAHVDLAFRPELKFRLGKFKAPIGLERLQSFPDAWTVENTYVSALTPNRDVGAQIYGDLFKETVGYAAGYFNGAGDNINKETDESDHKHLVARLWLQPFKNGSVELLRNFGAGFAASWGRHGGDSAATNVAAIRTPGQQSLFAYRANTVSGTNRDSLTVRARGHNFRYNPHGYWFWNNLGLFGEYVSSSHELVKPKDPVRVHDDLTNQAWTVTALYVITGEQPGFRGLKPRHPFAPSTSGASASPGQGYDGIGALELVGHISQFKADKEAFPIFANYNQVKEATTFGGGVTWYPVRSVKWLFNYEHTVFDGGVQVGSGAAATARDRDDEQVISTRLQFGL